MESSTLGSRAPNGLAGAREPTATQSFVASHSAWFQSVSPRPEGRLRTLAGRHESPIDGMGGRSWIWMRTDSGATPTLLTSGATSVVAAPGGRSHRRERAESGAR